MRKILLILFLPFLLVGCGEKTMNTPTKRVEMFFANYQTLDDKVLEQLNDTADEEVLFNEKNKKDYIDLMKKHYQDLKYDIKDEVIDGDSATVTVEIEVKDYSKALKGANEYLNEHPDEFKGTSEKYDESLFTTYRMNQLKDIKDTVKYTLNVHLTKIDKEWRMDDLTEIDRMKINGMYEY